MKKKKLSIGVWFGNSFTLVSPPYLAYNYAMFHTLGVSAEYLIQIKKDILLLKGNLSILGFGFRPSWTGYDFGLEKILEEKGLVSVIGYSYGKYSRFIFLHNYIRFCPSVDYQLYLNENWSLSFQFKMDINYISFPQFHFSLRDTLGVGIIFKW